MTKNTKEYNQAYYKKHREDINNKLQTKVKCQKCDRKVSYQWLSRHQDSTICKKFNKLAQEQRNAEQMDDIVNLLKSLNASLKEEKKLEFQYTPGIRIRKKPIQKVIIKKDDREEDSDEEDDEDKKQENEE